MRKARSAIVVLSGIIVVAALASSCGSDSDSTSGAARPGAPQGLSATPVLSIGQASGDTLRELDRVVSPFLMPDGRLVIPLSRASTIRVFGADGSYLGALGRSGEGPGEFRLLIAAWSRGDTIEAFDPALRRITRFAPDGAIDVVNIDRGSAVEGTAPGAAPDGWIMHRLARPGDQSAAALSSGRDDIVVHFVARDGTDRGEIARTLGIARYQAPDLSGPEPLSPRAIVSVSGGRVYVGETLSPLIRALEPDGALLAELSWEPDAGPSIAGAMSAVIDSALARAPAAQVDRLRTRLQAAPAPERLSVWWDFLVDALGFVWIRPYDPLRHAVALGGLGIASYLHNGSGQGGRWLILAPDGERVGEIDIPADVSPVQITSDALVGIRRDALGVESVQVYRVTRSPAGLFH